MFPAEIHLGSLRGPSALSSLGGRLQPRVLVHETWVLQIQPQTPDRGGSLTSELVLLLLS